MENGKISNALVEFEMVLKKNPKDIQALVGKARCLLNYIYDEAKLDEGNEIMNKLIYELNQESHDILLLQAKFLWRARKYNAALTRINFIKDRFGKQNSELQFTEARILCSYRIKRFKEALKISENLSSRERFFIQGRVNMFEDKFKDAFVNFKNCLLIDFSVVDDNSVDNLLMQALFINEESYLIEAIDIGKKFLEKHPDAYVTDRIAKRIALCINNKFNQNFHPLKDSKKPKPYTKKQKQIAKEYTDFVNDVVQSKQNELFEPEQITEVMQDVLNPLQGKAFFYMVQGGKKNHKEAITATHEFLDYLKKNPGDFFAGYLQQAFQVLVSAHMYLKNYDDAIEISKEYIKVTTKILKNPETKKNLDGYGTQHFHLFSCYLLMVECYKKLGDKKNQLKIEKKCVPIRSKIEYITKELKQKKLSSEQKIPPKYPHDEGERLEFKSSYFLHDEPEENDQDEQQERKPMNKHERKAKEEAGFAEIAESVCAFLNTKGGEIIIGIDDDRNCLGIEADIQKTKKKTYEAFTKTVTTKISSLLNEDYPNFVYWGDMYYPKEPSDDAVRLYRIFVDPLPTDEQYPSFVKASKNSSPIVYFRRGDGDASYKYEEGIKEWNRRRRKNKTKF